MGTAKNGVIIALFIVRHRGIHKMTFNKFLFKTAPDSENPNLQPIGDGFGFFVML